jgi:hypothetical protein
MGDERGFTIVGPGGEAGGAEREPALPPVDLTGLLLSLAGTALVHLGLEVDPASGQLGEKNLPLARHAIDTIEMLEAKTRGNTTPEEERLFGSLLAELRLRFVEASKR